MVSIEQEVTNNCSGSVQVVVSVPAKPDLTVDSVALNKSSVKTGETVSLQARVLNQGDATAQSTTLRYYLSTDTTIDTGDTELASSAVSALLASGSSIRSVDIAVPSSAGVYYLGACADVVSTEQEVANNCSGSVQIVVQQDSNNNTTNNNSRDSDGDGILDSVENANGLNPFDSSDAKADFDNDGFSNSIEIAVGTDIFSKSNHPAWMPLIMDDIMIVIPVKPQ